MDATVANLLSLQGRTVRLALRNGSTIEGCKVVALPTPRVTKFWVFTDEQDLVVAAEDIVDVMELATVS